MLKTLKRKIALVAVSVLGASGLAVVAAPSANAANELVAVNSTVTVSPVRVTFTGSDLDSVPNAVITVTPGTVSSTGAAVTWASVTTTTATIDLVSAPVGAKMDVTVTTGTADAVGGSALTGGTTNIAGGAASGTTAGLVLATNNLVATGSDLTFDIKASRAGVYAGTIAFDEDGAGGDGDTFTVSWTFTTTGAPASWTVVGASSSTLVGGKDTITITLKDANGNTTQPHSDDAIALTTTGGTSIVDAVTGGDANATISSTEIRTGVATATFTAGNVAGTNTVKATPQGILPALGFTASTLTYTVAGTVADTHVSLASFVVSTPADLALAAGTTIEAGTARYEVPEGTSSVTVSFTHATAGTKVRFKLSGASGTINGAAATTAQYVNVDTDATTGKATYTFTLGGSALIAGQDTAIEQVTVANAAIAAGAGGTTKLTIRPVARAAAGGTVTLSPTGSIIATVGTATAPTETEVTVTVADQFDASLGAGYTVRAWRTARTNANLLAEGLTGSDGTVKLKVKHATTAVAGTVETYLFAFSAPGVTQTNVTAQLEITYTATGAITSLSVDDTGDLTGAANTAARTNLTTTAQTVLPVISVPIALGVAGVNDDTTARAYTVATAAIAGGAAGDANAVNFIATATPGNTITWTGTEGVKFVTSEPTAGAPVAWDGGKATTTTASGGNGVWAFSTKAGVNTVTATSGGLSVTRQFFVEVPATEFYTVSVDKASLDLDPGAYAVVTVSVKDAFGNPVAATDLLTATATGAVLLGGFASTQTLTTGATGTAQFTVLGNNSGGDGSVAITARTASKVNAWASTYIKPTNAGAPVQSASVTAKVKTVTSTTNPAIEAVKTDVKAVSDTVATLSKAVTTVQSSVTELTSSFATQIKSLTDAIAKISRAIAALQKSLKKK